MLFANALLDPAPATQLKIKTELETRIGVDRLVNKDFASTVNDDTTLFLSRFRPIVIVSFDQWEFKLRHQFDHSLNWTINKNNSTERSDALDLYIRYKFDGNAITFGRQRFSIRDSRLLAESNWGNFGYTYQGIRFQTKDWDAFFLKFVASRSISNDARLFGLVNQNQFGQTAYFLKTDNPAAGHTQLHTLSHLWSTNFGESKASFEAVGQLGRTAGLDHSAYALHSGLTLPAFGPTTAKIEFNLSSGGRSANHVRTFDDLYPSTHGQFGYVDTTTWRNTQEFAVKTTTKVAKDWSFDANYHNFQLFDAADGFYSTSGLNKGINGNFIDPTGQSGRKLGNELDFQLTHKFKNGEFLFAYNIFQPGSFIRNLNGGVADNRTYFYTRLSVKF